MTTSSTHYDAMVATVDDWHPNFERHLVRVSFYELSPSKWRVCVWGSDDCGMERDFASRATAEQSYVALINRPYIRKSDLLTNHFSYC